MKTTNIYFNYLNNFWRSVGKAAKAVVSGIPSQKSYPEPQKESKVFVGDFKIKPAVERQTRRLFVILFLVMTVCALSAQTIDEEIDYIQAIFDMEKRSAVEGFIILQDSESEAFWKYYENISDQKSYVQAGTRFQILENVPL